MAVYKLKAADTDMKDESQEFKMSPHLQLFIDKDNKQYLDEETNKKKQKSFNFQLV